MSIIFTAGQSGIILVSTSMYNDIRMNTAGIALFSIFLLLG